MSSPPEPQIEDLRCYLFSQVKPYGSRTSPYVRKVRVYLEEAGLAYEFVEGDIRQPRPYLLSIAPIGKVPAIECEDGKVLFESLLIIEYLDRRCSADIPLLAADGAHKADIPRRATDVVS